MLNKNNSVEGILKTLENKNIGIAPGAGDPVRCWDFDKYLSVAKLLKEIRIPWLQAVGIIFGISGRQTA